MRPVWANAVGQLMAFLAYDLALIVPLTLHVADVVPEQRLSLAGYIAVLVISAVIAIYAFTIDRRTRIGTVTT